MTRKLCYTHHCEEFDTLPSAQRHIAATWETVDESKCELCNPSEATILRACIAKLSDALSDIERDANYGIASSTPAERLAALGKISKRAAATLCEFAFNALYPKNAK